MDNGPFIDVLSIKMVIFNSYVSLLEGNEYIQFMLGLPRFVEWIQSNPSSKCLALRGGARELEGDASGHGSLFGPKLAQATGQVGPFVTIEMTSQIRSKTSLRLELPIHMFRSAFLIKSSLNSCGKRAAIKHPTKTTMTGGHFTLHHPANWRYTQSYKLYWGCFSITT